MLKSEIKEWIIGENQMLLLLLLLLLLLSKIKIKRKFN